MSGRPADPSGPGRTEGGEQSARACAKVNLGLAITGRRADGYHALRSVLLRVALHDDVAATAHESLPAPVEPGSSTAEQPSASADRPAGRDRPGPADRLVVSGDPACPVEGNLVLRATALLRAAAAVPLPPLRLRLYKRIPMGAGLGGGSSDAAAALEVAGRAWGLEPGSQWRLEAALRLGADVPFFADGHAAAAVAGIGERLEPLPAPDPPAGLLLVTPPVRLATAAVFARLDESAPPTAAPPAGDAAEEMVVALADQLRRGLDGTGLASAAAALRDANDLWAPAASLVPGLAGTRAALESELGRPVLLSGSGTTLFAVYPSGAEAADAGRHLSDERPAWLGQAVVHATTSTQEGHAS